MEDKTWQKIIEIIADVLELLSTCLTWTKTPEVQVRRVALQNKIPIKDKEIALVLLFWLQRTKNSFKTSPLTLRLLELNKKTLIYFIFSYKNSCVYNKQVVVVEGDPVSSLLYNYGTWNTEVEMKTAQLKTNKPNITFMTT